LGCTCAGTAQAPKSMWVVLLAVSVIFSLLFSSSLCFHYHRMLSVDEPVEPVGAVTGQDKSQ